MFAQEGEMHGFRNPPGLCSISQTLGPLLAPWGLASGTRQQDAWRWLSNLPCPSAALPEKIDTA